MTPEQAGQIAAQHEAERHALYMAQSRVDARARKLHLALHITATSLVAVECLLMTAVVVIVAAHWF